MTASFDFYFSFRSPYSYLAMPQVEALLARDDAEVSMRIVRPIAVRIPGFFKQVNPLWPPYLVRDCKRIAEMNGTPYRWPQPDPIVQDKVTKDVAAEQPYIYLVSRMGVAAAEAGRGFEFVRRASHMMWGGEIDNWHEGEHLDRALEAAGLDPAEINAAIAADPDHYDSVLAANEDAQQEAGHWGVPLFVYNNEPFFGQDRIELLTWRMKQDGMSGRT